MKMMKNLGVAFALLFATAFALAIPQAANAASPARHRSVIVKFKQYQCGRIIHRHPCWNTVRYRVCYRNSYTQELLGCTSWRLYATWE